VEGALPESSETISARGRRACLLITAPAKAGKTCAAVATSPATVFVLGFEGEGSLDGAQELSPYVFDYELVSTIRETEAAISYIERSTSKYQTCVVDGITTMCEKAFAEISKTSKNPDPRSHYGDSN